MSISDSGIQISFQYKKGSTGSFSLPFPGNQLENFDATKEAIESIDFSSLEEEEDADASLTPNHRNSIVDEFEKKYRYYSNYNKQKGDFIVLESPENQKKYCIDVPRGISKKYKGLRPSEYGPNVLGKMYTWKVFRVEGTTILTIWGLEPQEEDDTDTRDILKFEFKLKHHLESSNGDGIENKQASNNENENDSKLRKLKGFFFGKKSTTF